jgi:hypothetical protein
MKEIKSADLDSDQSIGLTKDIKHLLHIGLVVAGLSDDVVDDGDPQSLPHMIVHMPSDELRKGEVDLESEFDSLVEEVHEDIEEDAGLPSSISLTHTKHILVVQVSFVE